jgi:tetratricopeptide (TPR) repeat protein
MKTHRTLVSLVAAASISALLWHGPAGADSFGDYQPTALRKAESALQNGYPDHALALLRGRDVEMRRWRMEAAASDLQCRAWFEKGDYVEAERACDEAVAASGATDAAYVYHRGVMRLLLGRVGEGIEDLRRASSMNTASGALPANLTVANRF